MSVIVDGLVEQFRRLSDEERQELLERLTDESHRLAAPIDDEPLTEL